MATNISALAAAITMDLTFPSVAGDLPDALEAEHFTTGGFELAIAATATAARRNAARRRPC